LISLCLYILGISLGIESPFHEFGQFIGDHSHSDTATEEVLTTVVETGFEMIFLLGSLVVFFLIFLPLTLVFLIIPLIIYTSIGRKHQRKLLSLATEA